MKNFLNNLSEADLRSKYSKILPPSIQTVVKLIGAASALILIKSHGGSDLYIPTKAKQSSYLSFLIGYGNARALADHYEQQYVYIPQLSKLSQLYRNIRILYAYDEGTPTRKLAELFDLSQRQVHSALKNARRTVEEVESKGV